MNGELQEMHDRLLAAIVDMGGSLHTQMQQMEQRMQQRFDERFDRLESRLDKQGGLITAGTRWMARMGDWSEDIDRAFNERDRKIHELEDRVRKLEGNGQSQ